MSGLDRRLNGVVRDLTPKERALLLFHARAREEPEPRIGRLTPGGDRDEIERLLTRLETMAANAGSILGLAQYWVLEAERSLHALQWLLPLARRIEELEAGVRKLGGRVSERAARRKAAKTITVTPLPDAFPWTYGEGLTLLFERQLSRDDWDDHPPDLDGLVAGLRHNVGQSLAARWQQALAWEEAFRQVADRDFDGDEIMHPLIRTALDELRPKVEALVVEARAVGVEVELEPLQDSWRDAALRELEEGRQP